MAYRNPRFYPHSLLRTAGAAALGGSAFATTHPRARAHDSAIARNAKFNASAANQYVSADRGAGFSPLPDCNRLIIPSGHNLSGATLAVYHNASAPASGTDGTQIFTGTIAAGLQVLTFGAGAWTLRYGTINVATSGQWEFGELWVTELRTTTRGPEPDWTDDKVANFAEASLRNGETYRLERGAERRRFVFEYRELTGADLAVFTDIRTETRSGLFPLYVDPPDDTESAILMQIVGGVELREDHPIPHAGVSYRLRLELLEVLA